MVAMVTNHPDGGRHVARPHPPFVPQISNFWGAAPPPTPTPNSRYFSPPQLLNCQAIPEVQVTACLVWKDWPHRVHPHGLVGKDCSNGLCQVRLQPHANPRHRWVCAAPHPITHSHTPY